MKIFLNVLLVSGVALALYISTRMLVMTHQEYHIDPTMYVYDQGNASPEIRAEILKQLKQLQEGYEWRDTTILDSFMEELFSRENILILGTMPGEIYSGYEEAADLVSSDWLYWGDVYMMAEGANVSARDSLAWFSMIGHVEFDLSRLLDLPLRITGVMVQTVDSWKFQQLQFQFDMDISGILVLVVLLAFILLVSLARLVFVIIRTTTKRAGPVQ